MRYPLREYNIWIGKYHLGQGYDPPDKPQKVATITAQTFRTACLKYELTAIISLIAEREEKGEYIDHQSQRWWYDFDNNSNGWTGPYFETEEEAWLSFPESKQPK